MRSLALIGTLFATAAIFDPALAAPTIWTYTVDSCTYDGGVSCPGSIIGKPLAELTLSTVPENNQFIYQSLGGGLQLQETGNLDFSLTLGFANLSPTTNICLHFQVCYWDVAYSATSTNITGITLDYGDGMDDTIDLNTFGGILDPHQGCDEIESQCQVTGSWTVSDPSAAVPEPSSIALVSIPLIIMGGYRLKLLPRRRAL